MEERLLDHHQLIVPDAQSNLTVTKQVVKALMSPFAEYTNADIEHSGLQRHIYTPLLYQIYAVAAGYHFAPQTKQIYKLKDGLSIQRLKKKYLTQFPTERIKKSQETIFNAAITHMTDNRLTIGKDDKNTIVIFLNEQYALEQREHTQTELIKPETLKTEEEILQSMVANGPFIDRAHLETVLAWHDSTASTATMRNSLIAGLEPSFTQTLPSKKSMIEAYSRYVQYQNNINEHYCHLDYMHEILHSIFRSPNLHNILCTQTVLCAYLLKYPAVLGEFKKEQLAVLCAKLGYAKALSILMSQGVSPDYKDYEEGRTLLLRAIENNHLACVNSLIDAGAHLDGSNHYGQAAIICAVRFEKTDLIKALIAGGANPNLRDKEGNTAIMLAIMNREKDAVKLFIDAGADLSLVNHQGKTAWMLAYEDWQIKETIMITICLMAIFLKNILSRLLQSIQSKRVCNDAPSLMQAAQEGDWYTCRELLKNGSNVNRCDKDFHTALDMAIMHGHSEVIKEIMRYEMTPWRLMRSIRMSVENSKYHNIVPLLFTPNIVKIMLRQKPNVIDWAAQHHCPAAVFELSRDRSKLSADIEKSLATEEDYAFIHPNRSLIYSGVNDHTQQKQATHTQRL